MSLRGGVLLVAGLSVIAGALLILFGQGGTRAGGVYLLLQAAICFLLVSLERWRYQPRARSSNALRPTGERSIDPVTGQLIEVWEDPTTGQREYRPVAPEP